MKLVGEHLSQVALARADTQEAELFGRSAFNRFYYASYLTVREALKRIDIRWAEPSHAEIPSLLRGKVLQHVKKKARQLEDRDQLSHAQAQSVINAATNATAALADLLTKAREVRRVADYEPDIPVRRDGAVMRLADETLDSARGWPTRAERQSGIILRTFSELGLI